MNGIKALIGLQEMGLPLFYLFYHVRKHICHLQRMQQQNAILEVEKLGSPQTANCQHLVPEL
jgi:hypothetical protein